MLTPISAEAVFAKHATALGLPPLDGDQSLDAYVQEHGTTDEAARCLKEATAAAAVADHTETAHWLDQARQHIPPARSGR
jgi:hypothetical protein